VRGLARVAVLVLVPRDARKYNLSWGLSGGNLITKRPLETSESHCEGFDDLRGFRRRLPFRWVAMPRRGRSAATLLLLLGLLSRVSLAALAQPKHQEGVDGGGRQLLLFNSSSIFSSSAAATLFSSNARSTLASPSSPSLGGGRPDGAYSVDLWAGKQIITTKHEPASHCGVISPVAFRSKVSRRLYLRHGPEIGA
jgi:hypothetical protein